MRQFTDYEDHYEFCRKKFLNENKFSTKDIRDLAFDGATLSFKKEYQDLVNKLAKRTQEKFSTIKEIPTGTFSLNIENPFQYTEVIGILDLVKRKIEREISSCYLTTNRVEIIRSVHSDKTKSSSWLWHYDNNSEFHFKLFIYLSDVDDNSAPFEYLHKGDSCAAVKTTRTYPGNIAESIFKHSRIPREDLKKLKDIGYNVRSATGPKGTWFLFDPNIIHRATVPKKGNYRDALVYHLHPISFSCREYKNLTDQKTTIYEMK